MSGQRLPTANSVGNRKEGMCDEREQLTMSEGNRDWEQLESKEGACTPAIATFSFLAVERLSNSCLTFPYFFHLVSIKSSRTMSSSLNNSFKWSSSSKSKESEVSVMVKE